MPTGYTAKLMKDGQTFREFILTCARAFGALIMMRDDPFDAPVPEKFEPSDYHIKALVEAKLELSRLKAMNDDEKNSFGQATKDAEIKRIGEWIARETKENIRLVEMEKQVKAWKPPTPDHEELKKFMLQQIDISKHDIISYTLELKIEIENKPLAAFYIEAVSRAAWNVKYHTEENEKEIERTNGRNLWIKQLRDSI